MTDFGDRVLALIIIATGLAGLFGWVAGTYCRVNHGSKGSSGSSYTRR